MRIVASAAWHQDRASPRLSFPEPGQTQTVWVPEYEVPQEATLHLLWCPPYAEENGWDSQPSEIALSQIVTGRIRRNHPTVSPDRPLGTIQVQCDVSIDSRIPLLDCVQANAHVPPALAAPMPSSGAHVIWRNVRWCGTAAIGGFTYLCALSGEANVELILRRQGDGIIVNYAQTWVDGWSECAIGCWVIKDWMLQVIQTHLKRAHVLRDQGHTSPER